jgi:hypothetical protein
LVKRMNAEGRRYFDAVGFGMGRVLGNVVGKPLGSVVGKPLGTGSELGKPLGSVRLLGMVGTVQAAPSGIAHPPSGSLTGCGPTG